jgi:hypothetical protein
MVPHEVDMPMAATTATSATATADAIHILRFLFAFGLKWLPLFFFLMLISAPSSACERHLEEDLRQT